MRMYDVLNGNVRPNAQKGGSKRTIGYKSIERTRCSFVLKDISLLVIYG